MPRYKLLVEYDGRPYKGFQAQGDLPTVQGSIERAILAFSGQALRLTAAGRTDTGVHATGQVITFDLDKPFKAGTVRDAINAYLTPEPIAILDVEECDPDFSARFSATGRMYLFRILNRRAPPAIDQGRVWHVKKPLDADAMAKAAKCLIGTHDFTTFRHIECQAKSPVKTLDIARVKRIGDEIHLVFAARSFLHRQVRSMTGSLAEAGIGRWEVGDVAKALAARDRTACGQVAPPEGLFLTHVTYEAEPDFESRSSI
ncbi:MULTISPECIES: tRNA pseudouridine(38-40) synthase TruA [Asticcacaulis]|uniref:tRNA pseudouridine(38-40) synthase TruA n=1 Tax=Asticcacaulis TaxID=76890 RepID=UPI001AE425C3|nr:MULTISPECIES: tRNA pseudouridine(38-40) synthase TruA [Asticcacaulis]MBP2159519.1 tRNA pseudouridine38-40 synthase [Asticcacaulis solisilvae]MDR6800654.1 tRNA pseudouridine38-40 synthase [Asticcacaulis sp. BE141]